MTVGQEKIDENNITNENGKKNAILVILIVLGVYVFTLIIPNSLAYFDNGRYQAIVVPNETTSHTGSASREDKLYILDTRKGDCKRLYR